MKKFRCFVLSALSLFPLCGYTTASIAQASSSLALYGRLDASVNVQNFSGGNNLATTGTFLSSDTSLFGLRGTENIGKGIQAYFKLENGFNVNNGTAASSGAAWSRESYVGIKKNAYGSIQFGLQYTPSLWLTKKADPFLRANTGAILTLFQL